MSLVPQRLPVRVQEKLQGAISASLDALEGHTKRSYFRSLVQFSVWLGTENMLELPVRPPVRTPQREAWDTDAVAQGGHYLMSLKGQEATWLVETYLRDLLYPQGKQRAYARKSVSSRLAALRWAVLEAQRLGHINWVLTSRMPRAEKDKRGRLKESEGRDMTGPTRTEAKKLMVAAERDEDPRALVIVSMARFEGYREHEMRQINLRDLDFKKGRVRLVRKKRAEASWYPLGTQTTLAIQRWLEVRGNYAGALLTGGVHGNERTSIGASTIWTIVKRVGKSAGMSAMSPHKIRHRACTDLLDKGLQEKWTEEDILFLTGHSSRAALAPYYETIKSMKSGRNLIDSVGDLDDET